MIRKDSVTEKWYHHIYYLSMMISNRSTLRSQVSISIRMKINKDQNEVCYRCQPSLDQSWAWLVPLKDDVVATYVVHHSRKCSRS